MSTQELALGYDLIADQLSQEEKSQIAEAFLEKSILPALEDISFTIACRLPPATTSLRSVGGAIDACVALYGDVPDWGSDSARH